jgi:hypothetical protein
MTERDLKIDLFDQFGPGRLGSGKGRDLARQFLDASLSVGWPRESGDLQYLYSGDLVMAIAFKAEAGGCTLGEIDG